MPKIRSFGKKKEKRPWRQRLSLKGALIFTTILCVIGGFLACGLEVTALEEVRQNLYYTYVKPYYVESEQTIKALSPEEKAKLEGSKYSGQIKYTGEGQYAYIEVGIPQFYRDPDTGKLYPMDETDPSQFIPGGLPRLYYQHSGLITLVICFLTAAAFFLINAVWFYRWKLKKPLAVLSDASEKISRNDLDFTVPQPSGDELGKLCGSFEKMRGSLEENNKAMWKAVEERRRLNAAFAHDLRTPLTVLQGYSDYLLDGLPAGKVPPEKTEETVSTMKRSLTRLQQYVEGMNSVQKLEDLAPAPGETDYHSLCAQIRDTAEILRGPEGFAFAQSGEGPLLLDQELVFRVFENLMSNAGRYAEKTVEISVEAKNGELLLTVADDGPGFPPEALKKAAQPYYRGEKKSWASKGEKTADPHFGLGLYICRVLCEKHGGSLTLQNLPQGGASVTARFSSLNTGK